MNYSAYVRVPFCVRTNSTFFADLGPDFPIMEKMDGLDEWHCIVVADDEASATLKLRQVFGPAGSDMVVLSIESA